MLKIGSRDGARGLTKGHATKQTASMEELLAATRAELDDMRAKYAALLAKLDADAGVTDTDYNTACALGAAQFEK